MEVPGVVVVGLVDVGFALPGAAPGGHGFATVAEVPLGVDVPLGVELLLVLDPIVVVDVPDAVPLVLHGPEIVPLPLVPIPVEVVPT